ncbi:MAG: methylmalonyl-CoA mutase subunit beta [Eudoraea sp.]|nr:methylmalonyl-CoA mutase subunit beta [Eudoraea sp.]
MKNNLFAEFTPISAKAWKQKIQVDLKGADYNKTLIWDTPENIKVKPFYNHEDLSENGASPATPNNWFIGQVVSVSNSGQANRCAHDLLSKGIESLIFSIHNNEVAPEILFKGIDLQHTPVYVHFESVSAASIIPFLEFAGKHKGLIFVELDPLGNLAKTGNWNIDEAQDLKALKDKLQNHPSGSILQVDMTLYQNAGGHMVQQLAYGIAHAAEYLHRFHELLKEAATPITFQVSVGSNYFLEIAKLRALRLLWRSLAAEFGLETPCHIVAQPSRRNKTLYDYNVNMLRTTTECMSAVLGGANTVVNMPYDAIYHKQNDFGDRIARNQLLILKKESYFDKVGNAADGAYYIESLTRQLAEKALTLFKDIEAGGGWLTQLKNQTLQRKIRESSDREQSAYDSGKLVLVGSNKYPNSVDRMKETIEKSPFLKKESRKTVLEPIIEKRLAEKEEQERLDDE